MGLPIMESELDSRRCKRFFIHIHKIRSGLGLIQPLILSIEEALCPGVKRLECEVNHSSPSSAALNNEWGYTGVLISP